MKKTNLKALKRAIDIAGGTQKHLADLLDVKQAHVSYWCLNELPVHRAIQIEDALNSEVTRAELRPDIFGAQDAA